MKAKSASLIITLSAAVAVVTGVGVWVLLAVLKNRREG
jgi:hypothetical protein